MSGTDELLSMLRQRAHTRGVRARHTIVAAAVAVGGVAVLLSLPLGVAAVAEAYPEWQRQAQVAQLAPIGSEVRDGPVTFVVHRARCSEADPEEARQGRLCEVSFSARNDGSDEVTVPASAQKLAGPDGARHLPMRDEGSPFGTLEPGENASGTLTFDVPPQARITSVRVFADPYSDGQGVALQRNVTGPE